LVAHASGAPLERRDEDKVVIADPLERS